MTRCGLRFGYQKKRPRQSRSLNAASHPAVSDVRTVPFAPSLPTDGGARQRPCPSVGHKVRRLLATFAMKESEAVCIVLGIVVRGAVIEPEHMCVKRFISKLTLSESDGYI